MTAIRLQAAALAVAVTAITLHGVSGIADQQHSQALAEARHAAATTVAAVAPAAQQVVIKGRRVRG